MTEESHISSVIVSCKPRYIDTLVSQLSSISHLEIVVTDKHQGKIIVVIDTPSADLTHDYIEHIKTYTDVMSVAMVYHHVEETHLLDEKQPLVESNS